MRIARFTAAAAILACASPAALADDAVIKLRQTLMAGNGAAAGVVIPMLRGQTPFDPVVAAAAARVIGHQLDVFPDLFPVGSETGNQTGALPAIWSDNEAFRAVAAKGVADAEAAAAAAAEGQEAFAAAFQVLGGDCQSCHQEFRAQN
jgi:cytochrome c556